MIEMSLTMIIRQMNEKLNIVSGVTTAEGQFNNGTVKWQNLIMAEAMQKTLKEVWTSYNPGMGY